MSDNFRFSIIPPFTRTSGLIALINSSGSSSSNSTIKSTTDKPRNTSALLIKLLIGRPDPFCRFTDESELRPTINISPNSLASLRYFTCPAWMKSKQPLVKTIFLFSVCSASCKDQSESRH